MCQGEFADLLRRYRAFGNPVLEAEAETVGVAAISSQESEAEVPAHPEASITAVSATAERVDVVCSGLRIGGL